MEIKVKLDLQSLGTSLELHGRLNHTKKMYWSRSGFWIIVTLWYFADPTPKMYGLLTTFSLIMLDYLKAYLPIIIIFLLFGIRDVWLNSDLWIRLVNNAELLQGDRVPAEIEKKEEKGNEAAIIDDINEDENIGAVKTKEDEAVNWKPKSR